MTNHQVWIELYEFIQNKQCDIYIKNESNIEVNLFVYTYDIDEFCELFGEDDFCESSLNNTYLGYKYIVVDIANYLTDNGGIIGYKNVIDNWNELTKKELEILKNY